MIQFTMVTITACHRNSVAGFAKDQLHQEHIFLVDSPFDPKETDTCIWWTFAGIVHYVFLLHDKTINIPLYHHNYNMALFLTSETTGSGE